MALLITLANKSTHENMLHFGELVWRGIRNATRRPSIECGHVRVRKDKQALLISLVNRSTHENMLHFGELVTNALQL